MLRRRLSLQLGLVMLGVALVPLVGAGWITLGLIERSVTRQVKASQEQLADAAGGLVLDYIKTATTKLKSISQMIKKDEDPRAQTKRLNSLLDPPDIFLEVSYWTTGKNQNPEVQAQVQQNDYNSVQSRGNLANRSFNSRVGQQVQTWSNESPILNCAANGMPYAADTLEKIDDYLALPISVPAAGGAVITANLDFRPVSQLLKSVAGPTQVSPDGVPSQVLWPRGLVLRDKKGQAIASSVPNPPGT